MQMFKAMHLASKNMMTYALRSWIAMVPVAVPAP